MKLLQYIHNNRESIQKSSMSSKFKAWLFSIVRSNRERAVVHIRRGTSLLLLLRRKTLMGGHSRNSPCEGAVGVLRTWGKRRGGTWGGIHHNLQRAGILLLLLHTHLPLLRRLRSHRGFCTLLDVHTVLCRGRGRGDKKARERKKQEGEREKQEGRGGNEELTTPRNNVWRLPNSGILNGKKLTFRTKFCDKTREISLKESGIKLWESLVETLLTWGVQISPGFHCGVGRIDRIAASCSEGTKADPAHRPCTAGWSCLPPGRRSRWKWRHRKHCPWQGHGSWLETTEGDKKEYNIAVVQYLHNCSCHNQRH